MAYSRGHGIRPSAFPFRSSDLIPYGSGRYYQPGHIIGEAEDSPASSVPSSSTERKSRNKLHFFDDINDPSSGTEEQEQVSSAMNPWEEGFRSARETLSSIVSKKRNEPNTDAKCKSSIPPSPTVEDYPEEFDDTNDSRGTSWNFDSRRAGSTNDRQTREEEPERGRSNQRGAERFRPSYYNRFQSTESTNRFPRQPSPENLKQKRSATPFTKDILSKSESDSDSEPESNDEMPSNDTSRRYYMSGANGPGDSKDNRFQDFFSRRKSSYNQPHPHSRGDTYHPQMSTKQNTSPFTERIRNRLKKRRSGDNSTGQRTNIFGSANSSHYPHYGGYPMSPMDPSMGYMGQPPPPWMAPPMGQFHSGYGEPPLMDPSMMMGMTGSMMGVQPSMTRTNPSMMGYGSDFSGWGTSPPSYTQSIGSQSGFFPSGPEPINRRLSRLTAARVAIEAKAAAATAAAATTTPTSSAAASTTPTNLSQLLGGSGVPSLGGQSNVNDPNSRCPQTRIANIQGRRIEIPPFRTLNEAISAQVSESQLGTAYGDTQQSDLDSRSMQDRMVTLRTGTGQSLQVPVPAGRSVNEVVDLLRRSGRL